MTFSELDKVEVGDTILIHVPTDTKGVYMGINPTDSNKLIFVGTSDGRLISQNKTEICHWEIWQKPKVKKKIKYEFWINYYSSGTRDIWDSKELARKYLEPNDRLIETKHYTHEIEVEE